MADIQTGTAFPCFTHCMKTSSKTKNGWGFINPTKGGLAQVQNICIAIVSVISFIRPFDSVHLTLFPIINGIIQECPKYIY
jgi:hypothetical protein